MEDIKLVLADIDGTLLNDALQVTERTRKAINSLATQGIMFGIATGRSPYAVIRLVKEWGIAEATRYIVGFNGCGTMDTKTQEMYFFHMLSGEGIARLLDDFQGFHFNAGIYDKEEYHAIMADEIAEKTARANHFKLVVDDLSHYIKTGAAKVLVTAPKAEMDHIVAYYETLLPREYHAFRSGDVRLECVNPNLTKSKGIAALCERLGITLGQVLTFGDMMNDYEMIRDCTGVAMGNADTRIKEVAKYITTDNNNDGIGVFLEDHILGQNMRI